MSSSPLGYAFVTSLIPAYQTDGSVRTGASYEPELLHYCIAKTKFAVWLVEVRTWTLKLRIEHQIQ